MIVTQHPSPAPEPLAVRVRAHDDDHFSTGSSCGVVAELLLSRGASEGVLPLASGEHRFTPGATEAEGSSGEKIAP